jgi:hypothetical protein
MLSYFIGVPRFMRADAWKAISDWQECMEMRLENLWLSAAALPRQPSIHEFHRPQHYSMSRSSDHRPIVMRSLLSAIGA